MTHNNNQILHHHQGTPFELMKKINNKTNLLYFLQIQQQNFNFSLIYHRIINLQIKISIRLLDCLFKVNLK